MIVDVPEDFLGRDDEIDHFPYCLEWNGQQIFYTVNTGGALAVSMEICLPSRSPWR